MWDLIIYPLLLAWFGGLTLHFSYKQKNFIDWMQTDLDNDWLEKSQDESCSFSGEYEISDQGLITGNIHIKEKGGYAFAMGEVLDFGAFWAIGKVQKNRCWLKISSSRSYNAEISATILISCDPEHSNLTGIIHFKGGIQNEVNLELKTEEKGLVPASKQLTKRSTQTDHDWLNKDNWVDFIISIFAIPCYYGVRSVLWLIPNNMNIFSTQTLNIFSTQIAEYLVPSLPPTATTIFITTMSLYFVNSIFWQAIAYIDGDSSRYVEDPRNYQRR